MKDTDTIDPADADCLDRLLTRRYSCRAFLPDPVPQETLERIVTMAQRTASWCNSQAWQVVITRGAATERFRTALLAATDNGTHDSDIPFPREYRDVYLARRRECGFQLYDSVGIAKGDRAASARQGRENFRLFGAPHVAIISTPEPLGTYGAVDCGAYVANFMAHRNFKRSVESLESPTQPWVGSRCLPGWLGTGAWAVALSGFGPP